MIQYERLIAIELGIIVSFPETNSMWAGYARVRIVSQLGNFANNGREQLFPISDLVIATTDAINNFLVIHGIIKGKAHTFNV